MAQQRSSLKNVNSKCLWHRNPHLIMFSIFFWRQSTKTNQLFNNNIIPKAYVRGGKQVLFFFFISWHLFFLVFFSRLKTMVYSRFQPFQGSNKYSVIELRPICATKSDLRLLFFLVQLASVQGRGHDGDELGSAKPNSLPVKWLWSVLRSVFVSTFTALLFTLNTRKTQRH